MDSDSNIELYSDSNNESDSNNKFPKRLKTLAFNVSSSEGNNLLHQFVLDNSDPNDSGSQHYITAVLRSMSDVGVNALNEEGYSALHLAVLKNNLSMVEKLLSCLPNIDINTKCKSLADAYYGEQVENTALHLATKLGHLSMIKELLNKGSDVNLENAHEETAIYFAVYSGNLDALKLLVRNGADINARHKYYSTTVLHAAAFKGRVEIVKYLVAHGADVDVLNRYCETPLYLAISYDHWEVGEFLVDQGASLSIVKSPDGQTLLHRAAETGSVKFTKMLLDRGASVDAADSEGETPLHAAASQDDEHVMRVLLNRGANVNALNEYKETPLHHAAGGNCTRAMRVLLERGADLHVADITGKTPLEIAELCVC